MQEAARPSPAASMREATDEGERPTKRAALPKHRTHLAAVLRNLVVKEREGHGISDGPSRREIPVVLIRSVTSGPKDLLYSEFFKSMPK